MGTTLTSLEVNTMRRIAIFAILAALLGTSFSALAAGPQTTPQDTRSLYEQVFNAQDLEHRF
jgi:hypothetical protein